MPDQEQEALALITLPDAEYFAFSQDRLTALEEQLSELEFEGIKLAGPKTVDISRQETLPLHYLRQSTELRGWEVEFRLNSLLLALDRDTGRLRWIHAFARPKQRISTKVEGSREGPRPEGLDAESVFSGVFWLDARKLLGLDWKPGRYLFWVLNHDWATNPVAVELVDGETRAEEPGPAARALARPFREAWRAAREDPERLPRYEPGPDTPVFDGAGCALALPAQVARDAEQLIAHGSARLPLPGWAALAEEAEPAERAEDEPPRARGILRGTLLFGELDKISDVAARCAFPVYGEPLEVGELAEGCFSVDLWTLLDERPLPGRFAVWFVVQDQLGGPFPLEITEPAGAEA